MHTHTDVMKYVNMLLLQQHYVLLLRYGSIKVVYFSLDV